MLYLHDVQGHIFLVPVCRRYVFKVFRFFWYFSHWSTSSNHFQVLV